MMIQKDVHYKIKLGKYEFDLNWTELRDTFERGTLEEKKNCLASIVRTLIESKTGGG